MFVPLNNQTPTTMYHYQISPQSVSKYRRLTISDDVEDLGPDSFRAEKEIGDEVLSVHGLSATVTPIYRIMPTGGIHFEIIDADGETVGQADFGSIDNDGQYEQDDDEVIAYLSEELGIPEDAIVEVR